MKEAAEDFFGLAVRCALNAAREGEVPVGAVLVRGQTVLAKAGNEVRKRHDPTAHAEILVLRDAALWLEDTHLEQCDLYVTLEPCAMCAAAASLAKIRRIYFGAYDPKGGGIEHGARLYQRQTCNHRPEVIGGVREREMIELLRGFFRERR